MGPLHSIYAVKLDTVDNGGVFIKKQILFFLVPLIISILLGYLTHNLMRGVTNGIILGIIFAIFATYVIKE